MIFADFIHVVIIQRDVFLCYRDDIPSKLRTDYKDQDGVKCFFVEKIKNKWSLCCSCNPCKNIFNNFHHLYKGLDINLKRCDNILILGDLNSEFFENSLH